MKDLDSSTSIVDVADAKLLAVQQAQELAAIKNASIRQAERQEKMELWSDPDAMAYRLILHNKKAFESLQSMKRDGHYKVQVPLPPESELPKEMRGQQPSTVRAWMATEPKYYNYFKSSVEELETKEKRRQELRLKYPEMFGIDDSSARQEWKPDDKPKDKKLPFKIVEGASPSAPIEQPGLIGRIFAGILGR